VHPDDNLGTDFRAIGVALADAVVAKLAVWVTKCVERRMTEAWGSVTPEVLESAKEAGESAVLEVGPRLYSLLEEDVDSQASTPLALVREAVRYPTRVLHEAALPPRARDVFAITRFPDDDFDLTPASLSALGEDVGELAIVWGAAKSFEHKRRHGG
jgi:hypothetical protein